jgi:small-conductance mechanosensitive channel
MRERRAVFQFGVTYDTPVDALAATPAAVRHIIEAIPDTRFDRCHFLTYGDTALQFEVVYFMTTADYNAYADAQQQINLAILERFRAMKVNFAASTRTVLYLDGQAPAAPGRMSS